MRETLRALLAHRSFRWLWLGQAVSVIGDRLVVVALVLYVSQIASPSAVGLVLAANTLPLVALLLIGGVWADRLPRHRVMLACDVVRALLHAGLAVLILRGEVPIGVIVAIEAAFGTAQAFFQPAYSGLLPQTVPEELVQPATALTNTTNNLAEFGGPALATALVLGVGAGWAFALDAATFAVSAVLLLGVRPRARGEAPQRASMLRELRAGWHEVRRRAWVWVTIAGFSCALLVGLAPYFVLGPALARDGYGEAATFGVLAAVFGAGTVVGSVLGVQWRPARPLRAGILACAGWPVMNALLALAAPRGLLYGAGLVGGAGVGVFVVWWETALAERIPPEVLGRVSAYDWMGSLGLLPVGYLLAGPAAAAFGAGPVLLGGAVLALVALGVALLPAQTRALARTAPGAEAARALERVA